MLNALTFKNLAGLKVTGNIFANHALVTPNNTTDVSAYVQQEDLFLGTLTVREHLVFQAMLRMDPQLKYKERLVRVNGVMADLGLAKFKDTVIGTPGMKKGIS